MLSVGFCNDEKTGGGGETAPWGTNCVVVASIGGQIHTRGTQHAVLLA